MTLMYFFRQFREIQSHRFDSDSKHICVALFKLRIQFFFRPICGVFHTPLTFYSSSIISISAFNSFSRLRISKSILK